MSHNLNIFETIFKVMVGFVPFLFALCFHEFAHGWVARLKGDRTAEIMGRLTLNPIAHIDPIGTLILPIFSMLTGIPLFGWAKPVPVDERNLKNPRKDMFWIAFAGPLSNMLLALIGAGALLAVTKVFHVELLNQKDSIRTLVAVIAVFIQVNIFLAVFNMIPLHPLDGGKVLARFLPYRFNRWLEDRQMYSSYMLLLVFVFFGPVLIGKPAHWIMGHLLVLVEMVAF